MSKGSYLFQIWIGDYDTARNRELQEALGRIIEGAGSVQLGEMLRSVEEGEPILVYQSNSRTDVKVVAGTLTRAGAKVKVDG